MRIKRAIKRMLLTLMWIGVGVGMFTIISAAMKAQDNGICKGYDINILGSGENQLFTSQNQIEKLIKAAANGNVKGQKKSDFNLPRMEDLLEQSSWVYNAELYFDNNDILHVKVTERKPLARLFTRDGKSFYIDEAGKHIPLSDKVSLDVPVFTGYPDKVRMNRIDSNLLQNMIATASFVSNDSFWASQVAEINIADCGAGCYNMMMTPVVGNHRVNLGDGNDIASKFHRLFLFYDQVLKKKGFDKYQKIDVQYAGQIIGMRDSLSKVDSLQLRKNIETLLQQSRNTNEIIEHAPSTVAGGYLVDTSLEASHIYKGVEEDTTTYKAVGDVEKLSETPAQKIETPVTKKEVKKAAPPVVKKAVDKPVTKEKQEVKKAAVKSPADAATEKTTAVKPPVKKTEKQAENKKPVTKAEPVKKPVTAKNSSANAKPLAKAVEAKKPAVTKPVVTKAVEKKTATKKDTKKPDPVKNVKKGAVKKTETKKN